MLAENRKNVALKIRKVLSLHVIMFSCCSFLKRNALVLL